MQAPDEQAPASRPGRILAAERERQGLGRSDIAQRLHMSVSQVEALEADDYARLPRGPFLRGFVRNYAKLLGLPHDDLLALLAEGAPREPAPRIVVPTQNIRFDPLADRYSGPYVRAAAIAGVVLTLGFAGMYWWLFVRNTPMNTARKPEPAVAAAPVASPPPPAAQEPKAAPSPSSSSAVPGAVAMEAVKAPEPAKPVEPPKAEPPKAEIAKAEPPKVEAPKVEAPKVDIAKTQASAAPTAQRVSATEAGAKLKLRFQGRSWVEIKDAGGRVLLTGLNDAGSDAEVSGRPPFRVIVGNAPQVRMYYNEREFDLAPHMREAVARVTIE